MLPTVIRYLLSIDCLRLVDSADLTSDSRCSFNSVLIQTLLWNKSRDQV